MSVCVVVSFDRCQICIIGKVDRSHQTFLFISPKTWRKGKISQLIKHIMTLAKHWIVTTEKTASICMIQLHADTAGSMAMTSCVYQLDTSVVSYIRPPTIWVVSNVTVLEWMLNEELYSLFHTCIISDTLKWAVISWTHSSDGVPGAHWGTSYSPALASVW